MSKTHPNSTGQPQSSAVPLARSSLHDSRQISPLVHNQDVAYSIAAAKEVNRSTFPSKSIVNIGSEPTNEETTTLSAPPSTLNPSQQKALQKQLDRRLNHHAAEHPIRRIIEICRYVSRG